MKKITPLKSLTFLIACFCVVTFGYGQSIFTNPITGTNPNTNNPYTTGQTIDANITVSGISRGAGISGNNASNRYNARSWNSGSIDLTAYFEFTITPNSGYEIDFSNFVYTSQRSNTSISNFAFRSSIDGYTSDIGTPLFNGATIDLSDTAYQNITSAITFRFYAWGAGDANNTFSINSFTFNGTVVLPTCAGTTTTWNGSAWDNGAPDITMPAIINGNYSVNNITSFSACSLTVNTGFILDVANTGFIEIENDVIVDGTLSVQTQGSFVQNDSGGTFTVNPSGTAFVNKTTATKQNWYYYTYWSSPVSGETIADAFPNVDGDRRFWFDASNYEDFNGDGVDDNGGGWTYALGGDVMSPGVGYTAASGRLGLYPGSDNASFTGPFNTGDIITSISYNGSNITGSWNLIGNPYPSAVDFIAFQAANSTVIDGTAYFWSQASPPDAANPGNQNINFSSNDYATYVVGTGGTAGASTFTPTQYIPSGQGFFIASLSSGNATFTNAMRMADATSNTQFFKNSNSKKNASSIANKLWINLTSDNGVFNQILIGYVPGATNENDGLKYDAPKLLSNEAAILYSKIENSTKPFVVQGKAINSLDSDETIKLGFKTSIDIATLYKLSIADFQGDFLTNNPIYLKDNLLNKLHDLSASDYSFTSEVGEFNSRFEIVFNANALSTETNTLDSKSLEIVDLGKNRVQFNASNNLTIKTVDIFDLLGRQIYSLKGTSNSETYSLSNFNSAIYIAKVALSNGAIITKKAIKK
ncbi:T9SS type A sorting domain-containing protein [Flavivirga jejuensis]|uniref:T9SS type A sorting domain-containing protein n=1 Tax=Flavivirga jejuensis TaxID=870487 RepID=A0ABT8WIC9_9FLAO|nr:T9SS type A sorting domain-containing protein [Flavivirga jejuensis]MDO5972731.1 T9SS type A sorting domain-containing protein [Flavivirga jejuensis]